MDLADYNPKDQFFATLFKFAVLKWTVEGFFEFT